MSWIDANLLAAMRADIQNTLPDTCNIITVAEAADGQGGWTETQSTATASVKCRIDQQTGLEFETGGALEDYATYILTLPHDTTIAVTNRVECNGSTFNVTHIDDDKSWMASKRVRLELR